ncbi:hypothetical protein DFH09DRAFT_1084145 [Mycena vulgaris]|nr:hypothetical protein DFH09DRAFT_1084145 [Mycena vulgaris]
MQGGNPLFAYAKARSSDTAQTAKKAARRREASRRYYARNPELREKSRLRMAQSRLARQQYKRQWDPPKRNKHDEDSSEEGSDNFELDENDGDANDDDKENWDPAYQQEVAAQLQGASTPLHSPIESLALQSPGNGKPRPLRLSEIDGYQSSEEDSVASLDDETRLARQELAERLTQLRQERRSRREQTHRARLQAVEDAAREGARQREERSKTARMRSFVRSGYISNTSSQGQLSD